MSDTPGAVAHAAYIWVRYGLGGQAATRMYHTCLPLERDAWEAAAQAVLGAMARCGAAPDTSPAPCPRSP